jgi:hypothetical protein
MKHLNNYKIFESETYKDPIDVESDVNEFLEKLGEKFRVWCTKVASSTNTEYYDKKISEVNHLSASNPTMTDNWDIYEVYSTDDYGRNTGTIINVKAVSKLHARIKAATIKNNLELFSTGFYDSKKISKAEYEAKIQGLERQIAKRKNIQ